MTTALLPQSWTELAHRSADGIEVSLLWESSDSSVVVVVGDARSGETFTVSASPENALDVFYHPYAYADRGGALYIPSERDVIAYAAA